MAYAKGLATYNEAFTIPTPNDSTGTSWYVRPAGGAYGAENGTSYANAWDGFVNIVWGAGGVMPGDTLYVAGTHVATLTVGASGTDGAYIKIYNYAADPGTIDGGSAITSCVDINSKNYIIVDGINVQEPTTNGYIVQGTSHHVYIRNCTSTLSGNQAFQMLDTATAYYQNIVGSASTDDGFSMHGGTAYIDGASFPTNAEGINIIGTSVCYVKSMTMTGNTAHGFYVTGGGGATLYLYASSIDQTILSGISAGNTANIEGCLIKGKIDVSGTLNAKNNKFYEGSDDQLYSGAVTGVINAIGNLFVNPSGSNKAGIYGLAGAVNAYNNTFVDSDATGIALRTNNATAAVFTNNIVYGMKYGTFQASTSTINGSNNDFYSCTTQHQGAQSLSGTLTVDPAFIRNRGCDYMLKAGNALIGAGATTGYKTMLHPSSNGFPGIIYTTDITTYDVGAVCFDYQVESQLFTINKDYPTVGSSVWEARYGILAGEATMSANQPLGGFVPFKVSMGTHKMTTILYGTQLAKAVQCVTAGNIIIPDPRPGTGTTFNYMYYTAATTSWAAATSATTTINLAAAGDRILWSTYDGLSCLKKV